MSRMERINQQIKREIGRIVHQELGDPRVQFVTIIRADVSPDLRTAKIYFSVLGDKNNVQSAAYGLNAARGLIRRLIGKNINLKYNPELQFHFDDSTMADKVEETLKDIHSEANQHHTGDQEV